MIRRLCVLLIGLLLIVPDADAQRRGKGNRSVFSKLKGRGVITGVVVESQDKKPLETTTVEVYKASDSSRVAGILTGVDGSFSVNTISDGEYYVEITFIGFKGKRIKNIKIGPEKYQVDLGTIEMNLSSTMTEGVEVTAKKPHVEFQLDKKIVNVADNIQSLSGSAVEALENVPSITIDIEGEVSLRGSTNFSVYIDGRPSILSGTEALEQIPATSIDKIEIITNPSAKYDPDGMAGIINVILKKDHDIGLTGTLNLTAGTFDQYRGSLNLNYITKKMTIFGSVDYNKFGRNMHGDAIQDVFYRNSVTNEIDSTSKNISEVEGKFYGTNYNVRTGISYSLTEKTSTRLSASLGKRDFDRTHNNNIIRWIDPVETRSYYTGSSGGIDERNYYRLSWDLYHNFEKSGHKISASIDYSNNDASGSEYQWEKETDMYWNIINGDFSTTQSDEDESEKNYRIKLDYELPYGDEGKLEAGYQSRLNDDTEFFNFFDYDTLNAEWVKNGQYSSIMDYTNNIHSIYAMASDNLFDNLNYQLGLRGEYTFIDIGLKDHNEQYTIDRFDLFPSLHLSYNLTYMHQLTLGYSRRIRRPHGRQLEPTVSYMDANNLRQGNPDLQPQFTNSYELGLINYWDEFTVTLEGYYRQSTDLITRIRDVMDDGTTILHTFQNMNSDKSYGLELMVNYIPFRELNFNLFGNFYKYELEGTLVGEDYVRSDNVISGGLNASYMLVNQDDQSLRFQINSFFSGPTVRGQDEHKAMIMSGLGIRYDFLDKKASISLSMRDMLNSMKREYESTTSSYYNYSNFDADWPDINLSFTYRFNNARRERSDDDNYEVEEFQGY